MYVLFGKGYFDGIDFPTEDAVRDSDFDQFQFAVAQDRNRLMAEAPDHRAAIREIREMTVPTWYRLREASSSALASDRDGAAIA